MPGAARVSMPLLFALALALALHCVDAVDEKTGPPVHEKAELDLQGFADVADRALPIIGLVYGPVLCFFGFAWYTHIAQVLGFLVGGVLFSLGAFLVVQSYSSLAIAFMIVAFISGGCIVGLIMRMRPVMSTFMIGGSVGVGLTYVIFFFAGLQLNNNDSPLLLLTGTTLLIVFGALFVRYERVAIIAFSSIVGAYSWLYGVGYFAGKFPTWRAIYKRVNNDEDDEAGTRVPWVWWLYAVAYVVLLAWSLWEQCKHKESEYESETKRETETRGPNDDSDDSMVMSPTMNDVQYAPYQRV